jgi:hypothetical protein
LARWARSGIMETEMPRSVMIQPSAVRALCCRIRQQLWPASAIG